jgi:hypothetical protein
MRYCGDHQGCTPITSSRAYSRMLVAHIAMMSRVFRNMPCTIRVVKSTGNRGSLLSDAVKPLQGLYVPAA